MVLRSTVWAWLAACSGGGGAGPATEVQAPAPGVSPTRDTLVVGWVADVKNLLAPVWESAADAQVLDMVNFNTIYVDFDCSLKKRPGLAKSWEWSEDGKVLKMEIRDDIEWEDGKPVTAEDFAFSYDLVADPAVASPRLASVEYLEPDGRPKIIDPTHLEWRFTRAFDQDTQFSHVSLPLVPKHVFESADRATLRGHERARTPLASGPWRVAKVEPGERIVLEPNPAYTGPAELRPRLDSVVFRTIPEYATRLLELEAGNIDLMEGLLVADADRLREAHPEIRLVRRGWRTQDTIAWNQSESRKNDLFVDPAVRRALAMAVDIEGMIGTLLTSKSGEPYARRSFGAITPALCGVHNDEIGPIPFDPEAAKRAFAEAGWRDTNGDGVLDKDGQKFEFMLSTNAGNKRRADAAVLLQDQLKKVGVTMNIEKVESNLFFERARKRDYEAALIGFSAGLFVDPSPQLHCDTPGKRYEYNFAGYCNPEVDKLMDQGLNVPDPNLAAPIWKEMQAKVYADQPMLYLWWMDEIIAVHERFEHTKINVLSPFHDLHEWEVPADKVKYE